MRHSTRLLLAVLASLDATLGLYPQKAPVNHLGSTTSSQPAPARPQSQAGTHVSLVSRAEVAPFKGYSRPANLRPPASELLVLPKAMPQFKSLPRQTDWESRDIFSQVRRMSRRGYLPVTAAKNYPKFISWCFFPSGWWAYGFVVPPQGKLHVRLHHPKEAWFRLLMVDRWGESRLPGMLQNLIPTGNPEVSYTNPMATPTTVYVIVDDPGWWSSEKNPYTLEVTRNWDVATTPTPDLPTVMGVWAQTSSNIPDIKIPLEPPISKAP